MLEAWIQYQYIILPPDQPIVFYPLNAGCQAGKQQEFSVFDMTW